MVISTPPHWKEPFADKGDKYDKILEIIAELNTPTSIPADHASEHQDGGGDEISVANLSGLLADAQTPLAHKASHQDGGGDEITVTAGILDIPSVRVYHSTTQSISDSTWTAVNFNSERFDNDSIHDPVTNNTRLTCKTAGVYQIAAHISFAHHATGCRHLTISVNGSTPYIAEQNHVPDPTAHPTHMFINTIYKLAVNDYIEILIWQNSGAPLLTYQASNSSPEFMMVWVSQG